MFFKNPNNFVDHKIYDHLKMLKLNIFTISSDSK